MKFAIAIAALAVVSYAAQENGKVLHPALAIVWAAAFLAALVWAAKKLEQVLFKSAD